MATQPGTWRYAEKFGRFEGKVTLGSEGLEEVDDLHVELVGPDGSAVALERPPGSFSEIDLGTHNLFQIGSAVIEEPGTHTLRVRVPDRQEPLLIVVGEDFRVGDAVKQVIPGWGLLRRLRSKES